MVSYEVITSSVIAGLTGLFIGSVLLQPSPKVKPRPKRVERKVDDESDEESDEETEEGSEPYDPYEECKMVLVVRTDLRMSTGKACAQCAHAAVACYESAQRTNPELLARWKSGGQAKIALKTNSLDELELLQGTALSLDVTARLIHDAGRTQIAAGSATVLGIGPAPRSVIDAITGHLKLY